jgi:hypothetical protein
VGSAHSSSALLTKREKLPGGSVGVVELVSSSARKVPNEGDRAGRDRKRGGQRMVSRISGSPELEVAALSPDKGLRRRRRWRRCGGRWRPRRWGAHLRIPTLGGKGRRLQGGASALWDWSPGAGGVPVRRWCGTRSETRWTAGGPPNTWWSRTYGVAPFTGQAIPAGGGHGDGEVEIIATGASGIIPEFGLPTAVETGSRRVRWLRGTGPPRFWNVSGKGGGAGRDQNAMESGWSSPYVPRRWWYRCLRRTRYPRRRRGWRRCAGGGCRWRRGIRTFEFRLSDGKRRRLVRRRLGPVGLVSTEPGTYRVKAVVRDAIGNTVEADGPGIRGCPKLKLLAVSGQVPPGAN